MKLRVHYHDLEEERTKTPDAYARLLLDAMHGDSTLFVRRDEAEQAWKWVDEVSEAWSGANFRPLDYAAGTWGPEAADLLLSRTGRKWNTRDE